MQLTPRYLVKNKIDIVADIGGFVTEYRPVYSRQVNLYKGIDNILEFRILNADQKPQSLSSYTPVIIIFDENNRLVLEKDCEVLDDSTRLTIGKCRVNISDNDTLNLQQQFLSYSIYLQNTSTNEKTLTYSDSHFGNKGTMFLSGEAMPGPKSSYTVEVFAETSPNSGVWASESITAEPALNGNEALHSAVIYTSDYTGTITVQATLEDQVSGSTQWFDVATQTLTAESEPKLINFYGVFSYVRFLSNANPAGKISKILVRN
jgi:hypothetical protein